MSTRTGRVTPAFAGILIALAALTTGGAILASNMGFKLNYRLNGPASAGGLGTGKNLLSLPYFRQASIDSAYDLMRDIGDGSIDPVVSISRFDTGHDLFQVYTGRMGSPLSVPFALVAGEGVFVQMASNVNYIVVGSHDPSRVIELRSAGDGSATGKNVFAPPYNVLAKNTLQLMQDIGGGVITPVLSISRFNASTDTFSVYTGRRSPSPTPHVILPGEAYFVAMASTIPYRPSHF